MSALTEVEIFDCLTSNLRDGAANCELLAKLPSKGPTYRKLRTNLQLIEGACRQMGFFRDDMRYQVLGLQTAHCLKRAGDWLRSHGAPELFVKLAATLRKLEADIDKIRHGRTGRSGPILAPVRPGPHRDTRPVYVRPSGLIVPATVH